MVALLGVTSSLALASEAYAEDTPIVAVFEIEDTTKRKKRLIRSLTDYLRVKLAESGRVKIVDKSEQERQIKARMKKEKRRSYRTCVDQSCQIPLGKELAADKILRSRLTRFGKNFVITSELIDLATETSAGAASAKSHGKPEELMSAVESVAAELVEKIAPPPPPPPPVVAEAPPPPPPPPPVVEEPKVEMVQPPATAFELSLIIGGWATFAGAYITVIVASLLDDNLANAYYALFPVAGPFFIELGRPVGESRNVLNFIDAGVQIIGALVAALGHVLVESKDPVPKATLEGEVSVEFFATPKAAGLAIEF